MNATEYGGWRRARPLWRAAVLALAICAVLPGVAVPPALAAHRTPEPAPAGVPEGFASWDELFAMQGQMNAAAEAILGPDLSAPDGVPAVDRGYASVVAAPEARELVIYWKGPVPDKVQAAIEDQRRNVPIRVAPATYSAQLPVARPPGSHPQRPQL